jgi:hypothetical protein
MGIDFFSRILIFDLDLDPRGAGVGGLGAPGASGQCFSPKSARYFFQKTGNR